MLYPHEVLDMAKKLGTEFQIDLCKLIDPGEIKPIINLDQDHVDLLKQWVNLYDDVANNVKRSSAKLFKHHNIAENTVMCLFRVVSEQFRMRQLDDAGHKWDAILWAYIGSLFYKDCLALKDYHFKCGYHLIRQGFIPFYDESIMTGPGWRICQTLGEGIAVGWREPEHLKPPRA